MVTSVIPTPSYYKPCVCSKTMRQNLFFMFMFLNLLLASQSYFFSLETIQLKEILCFQLLVV